MTIKYEVNAKDIEESLYCMQVRREKKSMRIHRVILIVLGIYSVWTYCVDRTNIMAFFISCMIIGTLFLIIYLPGFKRKKRAKQMIRKGTRCEISFPRGNWKWAYDSDHVITLQSDMEFYCIPKRVLSETQRNYIMNEEYSKAEQKFDIKF